MATTSALPSDGFWRNFWRFCRPHTIIGTSLSVFAILIMALRSSSTPLGAQMIAQGMGAWWACLLGNLYIVGLNQLEDIEIDRINKPSLPLASGKFSLKLGQSIVIVAGFSCLLLALSLGKWLFFTVAVSLVIGTAYSLPPLRLKRYPFWAALCILTVRGLVVNLGLFYHFNQTFSPEPGFSLPVILLTLFILFFSVGIALFKDVPDTQGDLTYQISTYTLIMGKSKILRLTLSLLATGYIILILSGLIGVPALNGWLLTAGNSIFLFGLLWQSRQVNLEETNSVTRFYQFIWKLFFLEYILFGVSSWLS